MGMPGREEQWFKGQEIKKPVLTGGKAGLASLLYIGVSWSCMMGWGKKGIVILFLKYQPSLAPGSAAALRAVQIQLQLLWTLPCLGQGLAAPAHTSQAARQGTALGQNTIGTGRCWQQSQSEGKPGFRGQNPHGTVSSGHVCAPSSAKLCQSSSCAGSCHLSDLGGSVS